MLPTVIQGAPFIYTVPADDNGNYVPLVANVLSYGAVGDGANDDTSAIQKAINAIGSAGGGIVFFSVGTYKTSATLSIGSDNVTLYGSGQGTIIKPASGANFDVISTPVPASAGLAGYVRNFIGIANLSIDCSNMAGMVAGQGNAIHWYGVRFSFIRDVYITSHPNWAILLDGDNTGPGNNFSYNVEVSRCVFDLGAANIYMTNSEADNITQCQFKFAKTATAAKQPSSAGDTNALHLRGDSGFFGASQNVFGNGGTYLSEAIRISNSGPCRIENNRFDQVRSTTMKLNAGNTIVVGNQFGNPSSVDTTNGLQIGSNNNVIVGNKWDLTDGAANYSYAIAESGGPFSGNVIQGNSLVAGTSGVISLNAGSTDVIEGNAGYNPVGPLTAPNVPASGTALQNTFGVPVIIYTTSGSISAIAVGNTSGGTVSTGQNPSLSGISNILGPGQWIKMTYSVAPTWTWFGL